MSRLVKIVNNKYVQIEEYKNPNICFNTNEYDNFEDYCTLRETFDPFEIFYENQELKKQLEEKNKPRIFIDTQDMEERYSEGLYQDYLEEENKKYKNQQKDFIEYMNKTIEELQCDDVDDEEMKGYLIQRIDTFKENLSKYKEIIGDNK